MSISTKGSQNPNNTIYIEYCVDCSSHYWCTKHDESKYYNFFKDVKSQLERAFPDLYVIGNHSNLTNKKIIPQLGAFEVRFRNNVLYSKIDTSQWPQISKIINRTTAVLEGRPFVNDDTRIKPKPKAFQISSTRPSSELRSRREQFSTSINVSRTSIKAKNGSLTMKTDNDFQNDNDNGSVGTRRNFDSVTNTITTPTPKGFMIRKKNGANSLSHDRKKDYVRREISTSSKRNRNLPPRPETMTLNASTNALVDNLRMEFKQKPLLGSQESTIVNGTEYFRIPISKRKSGLGSTIPQSVTHSAKVNKTFSVYGSNNDINTSISKSEEGNIIPNNLKILENNHKRNISQEFNDQKTLDQMSTFREDDFVNQETNFRMRHKVSEEFHKLKLEFRAQMMGTNENPVERAQTANPLNNYRLMLRPNSRPQTSELKKHPDAKAIKPNQEKIEIKTIQQNAQDNEKNIETISDHSDFTKRNFPFVKVTSLQASKTQPTKKKITLTTEEEGLHKLRVEVNDISIIKIKNEDLTKISSSNPCKLPLLFIWHENQDSKKEYIIQTYLDEKPWMKIYVNLNKMGIGKKAKGKTSKI